MGKENHDRRGPSSPPPGVPQAGWSPGRGQTARRGGRQGPEARRLAEGKFLQPLQLPHPGPPPSALWGRPSAGASPNPPPVAVLSWLMRTPNSSADSPPPFSPGRPLPAAAGIQMLRFSRQNWMASRCRKRARLCRKARRRAFRFAKLGSSAAPPEAGAAAPQVRLRPGFSGVCCGAGRRCRLPNAPLRKLSAPQRVGDPETREASVRGAGCPPVGAATPVLRLRASICPATWPGTGPDREGLELSVTLERGADRLWRTRLGRTKGTAGASEPGPSLGNRRRRLRWNR